MLTKKIAQCSNCKCFGEFINRNEFWCYNCACEEHIPGSEKSPEKKPCIIIPMLLRIAPVPIIFAAIAAVFYFSK